MNNIHTMHTLTEGAAAPLAADIMPPKKTLTSPPVLHRVALLLARSTGLQWQNLAKVVGNTGLLQPTGGTISEGAGRYIDWWVGAFGGVYHLRSRIGGGNLSPIPLVPEAIDAVVRTRISYNTGAINARERAHAVDKKTVAKRSQTYAENSLLSAHRAAKCALQGGVIEVDNIADMLADVARESNRAADGGLPPSAISLLTGIPARSVERILQKLVPDERAGLFGLVNGVGVMLQSAGVKLSVQFGRRVYKLRPKVDRKIASLIHEHVSPEWNPAAAPSLSKIQDPEHRRLLEIYLSDRDQDTVERDSGCSREWMRRVRDTYGVTPEMRRELLLKGGVGSVANVRAALHELRELLHQDNRSKD